MDASCKIQENIHLYCLFNKYLFRILVHIKDQSSFYIKLISENV